MCLPEIGILTIKSGVFANTPVVLCCYSPSYSSLVWGSAAICYLQVVKCTMRLVARHCLDQSLLPLNHHCIVARL